MPTLKEIHQEWGEPAVSDYNGFIVVTEQAEDVDLPNSELPRVMGLYPDGCVKMRDPASGYEYRGKYTAEQITKSVRRLFSKKKVDKLLEDAGL